jgi:Restriction endonuclease XhoI
MAVDLAGYETKAREAVMAFWGNREKARQKQVEAGSSDVGERASVTGGANMDGFVALVIDVVRANGLGHAAIHRKRSALTLPGYFRPTKLWDLLVLNERCLVAAVELKSQVGPSFGNNFNNRTEEAVGTGHDFWTAYQEGALGNQARPFLGWMMLIEDAPGSRRPVRDAAPHFPVFPEFQGASYVDRYGILCRRLVRERLYTAASVIASPRSAKRTGDYAELDEITGLRTFMALLARHVAAEAARSG